MKVAFALLSVIMLGSAALFVDVLGVRYERDVTRIVFNDNVDLLREIYLAQGVESDSLARVLSATPDPPKGKPYIVVSIEEHRLWYRQGDSLLFTAPVATGSGKTLEGTGDDTYWRFDTPRGRLRVIAKDSAPVWVAPDWHYVEAAQRRGLGVVRLQRGVPLRTSDGSTIQAEGSDVVRRSPGGHVERFASGEGNEIVADGNIVIPPHGTTQRKFDGVLGTFRLELGDGYAIHGTNDPESIGRSISHGCVRLLNDDIGVLYHTAPLGTTVFIY